jgi:hypothetical protein
MDGLFAWKPYARGGGTLTRKHPFPRITIAVYDARWFAGFPGLPPNVCLPRQFVDPKFCFFYLITSPLRTWQVPVAGMKIAVLGRTPARYL